MSRFSPKAHSMLLSCHVRPVYRAPGGHRTQPIGLAVFSQRFLVLCPALPPNVGDPTYSGLLKDRVTVCRANSMPISPDHRDEKQCLVLVPVSLALSSGVTSHLFSWCCAEPLNSLILWVLGFWFFFCLNFSVNI